MPAIPETMRQVRFNGAGGPEVIGLETAPVPRPGPGEVLIAVAAAGVNRPDCQQRAGKYPPPPGATEVPGLEVAGRVVALGEDVTTLKEGDEVCALVISGGYAEYCVAAAALCLPRPKPFSLLEAASLPENMYTVYTNVVERGRLSSGERFLVHGGSSGIGYTAIQLAKQRGATVYATAGSADKCAFCESMGADAAINYKDADFAEEVKRLTDGKGVDLVLDMVGAPYFERNLKSLALEGRLVIIAFMQGFKVEDLNLTPIMVRRLTVTGSTLRPRTTAQKAAIAEGLRREVWPWLDDGGFRPVIHATFPLEQAREAHALMESSAHLGKIMLTTGL
ncbi:NAD(P)H-quinone oxidoreductase [Methylobacterium sp. JK268]